MFIGNRGNDAAAKPVADFPDDKIQWKQSDDRLRRRNADRGQRKGMELQTGGCDLFYALPRGSYQRTAGNTAHNGKCGTDRAAYFSRSEGIGAGRQIELCGYVIHAFRVNHNITCYGYSIEIKRTGKFSVEAAHEKGIPQKYWNRLQKGETLTEDGRIYTPDMVLGPPRKGIKVTYCTDTRPTASIVEHAKGSDLFICEGMYAEKEKITKAKQYKHMTFYEAAQMAKEAGVKELWLTHYSPSLVRPEDYKKEVQKVFANTVLGKDGKTVEIDFEEE